MDESGPLGEEALTPSVGLDVGHEGESNEGCLLGVCLSWRTGLWIKAGD